MKKNITFEQATGRLDEIVAALERSDIPLEESLKLFGEGAELLAVCEAKLSDAKLKIEKLFPEKNDTEVLDGIDEANP